MVRIIISCYLVISLFNNFISLFLYYKMIMIVAAIHYARSSLVELLFCIVLFYLITFLESNKMFSSLCSKYKLFSSMCFKYKMFLGLLPYRLITFFNILASSEIPARPFTTH